RPSSSSPNNTISTTPFSQYTMKNPLNLQSSPKQNRIPTPLSTPLQMYDEKIKEPLSSENYSQRLQVRT
ncbi:unnamed protein product, partial [Rotaria sp. Silwood2]